MIWFGAHKQVDRHFAGLGTPARDGRMFQHLKSCSRCRERYRTYATLEQLAPGSDVISSLNAGDETPDGPELISIWTSQDEVVSPPDTAHLDGARNVVVQRICPGRAVNHGQLPTDAVVDALVLRALAVAPFVTPTGADCSSLAGQS